VTVDTTDVDRAEQILGRAYLSLRLYPGTDGRDVRLCFRAFQVGRATIGYVRFGTHMRVATDPTSNYHLDIPLAGRSRSRSGGRPEVRTAPGTAAVFVPGEPVDLDWTGDTEQLCLMLGKVEVERELVQLLGREMRQPLAFEDVMDLRIPAGHGWLQTLRLIEQQSGVEGGLLHHDLIARRFEQLLIDGLLIGHRHNYSDQLFAAQATPGRRAVCRAVEMLQSSPEHAWTTTELAADVAVSVRSLQAGFRDVAGIAPMAYLRHVRLQRVHDELTDNGDSHSSVSNVAHRWGFVHLGRFSSAYRRRYGELPSQTLGRRRGR
jgi:AraC-like DNA-binding protein